MRLRTLREADENTGGSFLQPGEHGGRLRPCVFPYMLQDKVLLR